MTVWWFSADDGREVVIEEVLSLDAQYPGCGVVIDFHVARVDRREAQGKKLAGTDLWEVKVSHDGQALRVLYALVKVGSMDRRQTIMLMVRAFYKKSPETPKRELKTANSRLRTYRSRSGSG